MVKDKQTHDPPLTSMDLASISARYAGKYLLRNEIYLDDAKFNTLHARNYFKKTSSIQHHFFHSTCNRCHNRKQSLMGTIPCEKCGKTHVYCRNCIQMGRVMSCEPLYEWVGPQPQWPIHTNACTWEGQLTPAQKHAAAEMAKAVKHTISELLTWAVCGAGKTEMLFPAIEEALSHGKRICIATPRSDVVRELLPRIKAAFKGIHVQGLYGGSKDNEGDTELIISTTHQLLRFKDAFDVMIIDEVDAFPYHNDPSLISASRRALKKRHTILYLTATPRKEFKKRMKRRILPYVFVPTRFHGNPLPIPTFKMCFSLKKDLKKHQVPNALIQWMENREKKHRQVLIFVSAIQLAEKVTGDLRERFAAKNQNVIMHVHADDKQRKEKVNAFRNKEIDILVTTTILERGVTFPSVDVAILDAGHEVFDEAALVQIAGRAGRSVDDPTGEVLFFHDGKTMAMKEAVQSIEDMNKRGGF